MTFELDKQINADSVMIKGKFLDIVSTKFIDVDTEEGEYQVILEFEDKNRKNKEFFIQFIITCSILIEIIVN